MGEVQPAAPGHEEFAADGGHSVEDRDGGVGGQDFGGGEASGACADDGDGGFW